MVISSRPWMPVSAFGSAGDACLTLCLCVIGCGLKLPVTSLWALYSIEQRRDEGEVTSSSTDEDVMNGATAIEAVLVAGALVAPPV